MSEPAAERKRKRLEAWRKRQQQEAVPAPKVSISLGGLGAKNNKNKSKSLAAKKAPANKPKALNPFFADADDEQSAASDTEDGFESLGASRKRTAIPKMTLDNIAAPSPAASTAPESEEKPRKRQKTSRGRWDKAPTPTATDDALDKFMEKLQAGAMGNVSTQREDSALNIDVSGSMMPRKKAKNVNHPVSGGVITPEELERLTGNSSSHSEKDANGMDVDDEARYTHSDWESDANKSEVCC
jgi:hypothetical protein